MRTFTTNVAAGVAGDSEPIYLIKISPCTTVPADSWSAFRWGTRAIDFGSGENYLEGVILQDGIKDVEMGVDLEKGGNTAEVAEFELEISNAQYSGDTRFDEYVDSNNIYFENRIIELRIIFADKTPLDWANAFVVWSGIIEKAYAESYGVFKFVCVDSTWTWDREIPQTVIDTKNYAYAHKDTVGKVIPITFGDIDHAKGLCIYTTLGVQTYKWDTEEVKQMDYLFAHDADFNTFPKVCATQEDGTGSPEYGFNLGSANATFNGVTNPFAEAGLILFWEYFEVDKVLASASASNPGNAYDGDASTYATVQGVWFGMGYIVFGFEQTTSLGELLNVYLIAKVSQNAQWNGVEQDIFAQVNPQGSFIGGGYNGGSGYDDYSIERIDCDSFNNVDGADAEVDKTLTEQIIDAPGNSGSGTKKPVRWKKLGWDSMGDGRLTIGGDAWKSTNNAFVFYIYEVKLLVHFTLQFNKTPHLFCQLKGRVF